MVTVHEVRFRDNRHKADGMQRIAVAGVMSPFVQHWAEVFRKLPVEARPAALLQFCQWAIEYVRDPREEVLEDPPVVLLRGHGDCDAKTVVFVALSIACGVPARVLPVFRGEDFPHVMAEVFLGGRWIPADPTVLNSGIGSIPPAARAVTNYR